MNADTDGLSVRIRECARIVGGGEELARRTGIPRRTLENYFTGREPQASRLAAIADAAQVSLDWLVTGRIPVTQRAASGALLIDPDFMGRLFEAVARAHRDAGINLPDVRLGQVVAEVFMEVIAASEVADEYPEQLEIMIKRLKRRLKVAKDEPGTGKRSA